MANEMMNNGAAVQGQAQAQVQTQAVQGAKASPRNLNMMIIEGNLAADANLAVNAQGRSSCFFRVAVNEGYLRRDGSNAVSFITCVVRDKRAESLTPYLKKGMRLTVTGSASLRSEKQPDGKYTDQFVMNVDNVFFGPQPQRNYQAQAVAQPQAQVQLQVAQMPQYQQPQAVAQPVQQPQYQQPAQAQPVQMPQAPVQATAQAPAPQYQQVAQPQAAAQPVQQPQYQQPAQNPFLHATPAQANLFAFDENPFGEMAGADALPFA